MYTPIDLYKILADTGSIQEAAKIVLNILKKETTVGFEVKLQNLTIDDEIIKIVAVILHNCEKQGTQVVFDKELSKEDFSRVMKEKKKMDCDVQTEGRETFFGEVINME